MLIQIVFKDEQVERFTAGYQRDGRQISRTMEEII